LLKTNRAMTNFTSRSLLPDKRARRGSPQGAGYILILLTTPPSNGQKDRPWPIPLQAFRNDTTRSAGAHSPRLGRKFHPNGHLKWQNGPQPRLCFPVEATSTLRRQSGCQLIDLVEWNATTSATTLVPLSDVTKRDLVQSK
jgi:hypothetical protein